MDKGLEAYISNKNHFSDGVKFQGGRQHWTMNKKRVLLWASLSRSDVVPGKSFILSVPLLGYL